MDELGVVVQDLRKLPTELINLLLDQEQRLVIFFSRDKDLNAAREKPAKNGEARKEEKEEKNEIERFHDLRMWT
jgi:aldehyde:ferredoxin oxidoreductase